MKQITDIVQINYGTEYHQLPAWAQTKVLIGGPGFSVASGEFVWGDYVVRVPHEGVMGMKQTDVALLLSNAVIINKQLSK